MKNGWYSRALGYHFRVHPPRFVRVPLEGWVYGHTPAPHQRVVFRGVREYVGVYEKPASRQSILISPWRFPGLFGNRFLNRDRQTKRGGLGAGCDVIDSGRSSFPGEGSSIRRRTAAHCRRAILLRGSCLPRPWRGKSADRDRGQTNCTRLPRPRPRSIAPSGPRRRPGSSRWSSHRRRYAWDR